MVVLWDIFHLHLPNSILQLFSCYIFYFFRPMTARMVLFTHNIYTSRTRLTMYLEKGTEILKGDYGLGSLCQMVWFCLVKFILTLCFATQPYIWWLPSNRWPKNIASLWLLQESRKPYWLFEIIFEREECLKSKMCFRKKIQVSSKL